MSNPFNQVAFKGPERSSFHQPHKWASSMRIGKIRAVEAVEMLPGDSLNLKIQQLTRSNAFQFPIMHNVKIDYHSIFVPARLLAPHFENFFNYALSAEERPAMPMLTSANYVYLISRIGYSKLLGSLFDDFNFPLFDSLYRFVISSESFRLYYDTVYDVTLSPEENVFSLDYSEYTNGQGPGVLEDFMTFAGFLVYKGFIEIESVQDLSGSAIAGKIAEEGRLGLSSLDLWNEYVDYFMYELISHFEFEGVGLPNEKISLYPIFAYWRAIYDWYINTNIDENVSTFEAFCLDRFGFTVDTWASVVPEEMDTKKFLAFVSPADRLWSSDYFTSAFISPEAIDTVMIPSEGSISVLRFAEDAQLFRERLMYSGKRPIDQILGIFGVHSSNALLDHCELCGAKTFSLGISDVTQTSESTSMDNPLGKKGGEGISAGQDSSFAHFYAEEYGLLLVFASIKPEAVYSGVVDKLVYKTSQYDFLIPDMANVGEQEIRNTEIDFRFGQSLAPWGYNRRYSEYMFRHSTVHGEFRTSLDFVTMARQFESTPVLNSEFIRIDTDRDNLNRVFAVPGSDEQFQNWTFLDLYVSRPLSRMVQYGF